MELTEQNFKDRLKRIAECQKAGGEQWESCVQRLKEKGVEYCVVLPLFEVVLGFDPLEDIKMEQGSTKYNNQIFDFIVTPQKEDHFSLIVEAKSFGEQNLKKHEEQIVKYMKDNPEYPWGILTNGLEWRFFLTKKYIELKFNDGCILDSFKNKKVFNIINISLNDENFVEIMQAMGKGKLGGFWYNLSKYTYSTITGGRGKRPNIDSNRQLNDFLTEKVREAVESKTGEYWQSIQTGVVKPGDKVVCENNFIKLIFEIDNWGRLLLNPQMANSHDFNEFTKNCPSGAEVLMAWNGSTNTFVERSQVVLLLTGGKKFTHNLKSKFPFDPMP